MPPDAASAARWAPRARCAHVITIGTTAPGLKPPGGHLPCPALPTVSRVRGRSRRGRIAHPVHVGRAARVVGHVP